MVDRQTSRTLGNKGFSLVELLMIMAIVGILASLSIPAYNNYVNKTKTGRAKSEIRTLGTEITGWSLDHSNTPPANLTLIGRDNLLDPWKNPYVYLPVPALQDDLGVHNLNTDFDVYSKGADGLGTTAGGDPRNKDDITRANDGTFVGMREEFE